MSFTLLRAAEAEWQTSRAMGVPSTDLAAQLGAATLTARLWRLEPGRFLARHRHPTEHELYVLLEGTGRIRVEDQVLTLQPRDTLLAEPATVRQLFNDTAAPALWLVVGAPRDAPPAGPEEMAAWYPDGLMAPPPELA